MGCTKRPAGMNRYELPLQRRRVSNSLERALDLFVRRFQSFQRFVVFNQGPLLTLVERVQPSPATITAGFAMSPQIGLDSFAVMVVVFQLVACDQFLAFGTAHKDDLGFTVANDDVANINRMAGLAGLSFNVH